MIDISGHLRDYRREIGFSDESKPLIINCCGYQKFMTENFSKSRPAGRLDYQLIYIYQGQGTFWTNGKSEKISSGNIVLFKPNEPQIYSYSFKDSPVIYWIHFTGNSVKELLSEFHIQSCYIGEHSLLKNLFQEIIMELQLKKTGFETIINATFQKLVATVYRYQTNQSDQCKINFLLDSLIIRLNQSYRENWTVKSMAEYCNLSESYFAHYFKEIMKMTPMQYLTNLRITKAKDFLLESDLSITNIASLLGYDDSLYFSRVFKKHTGYSPSSYQKNQLKIESYELPKYK